jgi:hypothetical protein
MLLLTFFAFRRFAALRSAVCIAGAAAAAMLIAEFAVLAAPPVKAQTSGAQAQVVFEGRYSGEPQLVPMPSAAFDTESFGQP